jgi:hypothetical protein
MPQLRHGWIASAKREGDFLCSYGRWDDDLATVALSRKSKGHLPPASTLLYVGGNSFSKM